MTSVVALPPAFRERLERLLEPAALAQVIASFRGPKQTTLRLNPLRGEPEATLRALVDAGFALCPLPGFPHTFLLDDASQRSALTSSPFVDDGRVYIQNPSSMLAALALEPAPGDQVLDLCAAPGGKTLLLAALMGNQGRLSAVEPVRTRFFKLQGNLDRGGATLVKTYMRDGRGVGRSCPEWFGKVLLDAPCSSEARFRLDDPKSFEHWSPRKVKETSRTQRALLASAADSLAADGLLLYSTCSFAPEENELGVSAILAERPELECLALPPLPPAPLSPAVCAWDGNDVHPDVALHARRILPDGVFDGFFLCLLRKTDSTLTARKASSEDKPRRPKGRKWRA